MITDAAGFPVGNVIAPRTPSLFGFGMEWISTPAERNQVMGRVLDRLLG